ncbi:hypothetical protein MMC20_002190 [Loxospora ochrophaea]|nr:hypothetical protein [Loxospora ochrophaea]
MTTYTGKCHCGEVEFTAKIPEANHVLCHCDTCKTLSGSAFTLNTIIPQDDLKITKGSLKTYTYYGDSGKGVHCNYCPNCTSHIYHHQEVMGPKIVVRTILLNDGKSFKPGAEVYGKDRLGWEPEVATTFQVMPPA